MVKKIVLGALLFGLIGILVAGAMVRTLDKTGSVAEARGEGRSLGAGENAGLLAADHERGTGMGGGQQALAAQGGGGRGQGQGNLSGDQAGTGQAQVDAWITLQGVASSVDTLALTITTADGQPIVLDGRAWRYLLEQGFQVEAGDPVELVGFYESEVFEAGELTNLGTGQDVPIRDASGRPLWAGRGRGSS